MKLLRLALHRWPGIHAPFELDEAQLAPGVTLIHGPNATGKTSTARALAAVLWRESASDAPIFLEATFEEDGVRWSVEREGERVQWRRDGEVSSAPPLPAAHDARNFVITADELLQARGEDQGFSDTVRIAMAGGVDLPGLRERLAVKPQLGMNTAKKLAAARRERGDLERAQTQVLRAEDRLPALEAELEAARAAERETQVLEAALDRIGARARLEELQQHLDAFPEGMDALSGDEDERLHDLREGLAAEEDALARLAQRADAARAALQGTRLAGPIAREELETHRARLSDLKDLERSLDGERRRAIAERATLEAARTALGADADVARALEAPSEALWELEELVRAARGLGDERAELTRQARRGEAAAGSDIDSVALARATGALSAWLRAESSERGGRREPWPWILLAGFTSAAVLLGLLVHVGWFALLLLAALAGLRMAPRGRGGVGDRAGHEEQFTRTTAAPPATWERAAVEARLAELERERPRIAAAEHARGVRREAEAELEGLAEREAAHGARCDALRERLGVDVGGSSLALEDVANRLKALRTTHAAVRGLEAGAVELESRCDELADGLGAFLREHGEDAQGSDAATLGQALDSLAERSRVFEKARDDIRQAEQEREGAAGRRDRAQRDIAQVFERLGLEPGDREGLAARLAVREEHAAAKQEVEQQRGAVRKAEEPLAAHAELARAGADELETRLERSRELASVLEERLDERARIRGEVQRARAGRALESAAARVADLERELGDARETALDASVSRLLLDAVDAEHAEHARPPLLERARELFAGYTSRRWELDADPRDGALYARESRRPDRRLDLDELSSGTRVQLLLAARLAFLETAERGVRLPLVLDDALINSDDERAVAIGASLFALARAGRQVLVLSSDASEAGLLRAGAADPTEAESLRVVDLAALRRVQGAESRRERLAPPARPALPSPAGRSPEEYALEIGVQALDPRAPVEDLDLFWLLVDDLELLHHLRQRRIERYGVLRATLSHGEALGLEGERVRRIDTWARLAEVVLESWRIGRGLPLSGAALRACPAISENFRERAEALARSVAWSAAELVGGLRSGDLKMKHFSRTKLDEAEAWFIEEGHLSPEEPLDLEAARRRVARALGGEAALDPEALHRRVEFLWARCEDAG